MENYSIGSTWGNSLQIGPKQMANCTSFYASQFAFSVSHSTNSDRIAFLHWIGLQLEWEQSRFLW